MKSSAGYSVFEVLIAFAIMALVLSALLPGQARLLARATSGDDAVLAFDFAQSRLATLAAQRPIEIGETTFANGDWTAYQSTTVAERSDEVSLFEFTVIVEDATGRQIAQSTSKRWLHNDE